MWCIGSEFSFFTTNLASVLHSCTCICTCTVAPLLPVMTAEVRDGVYTHSRQETSTSTSSP